MPTSIGTIKHRHQSALPPGGHDVDVPEWNDSLIIGGGTDGAIFVRDSTRSDGWGLTTTISVADITASTLTVSGAVSAATVTASGAMSADSLTVTTTINAASVTASGAVNAATVVASGTVTAGGVTTTGALAAASLTASSYIAVGTNPATTGVLRLPNNQGIYSRDSTNTNDYRLLAMGTDNVAHCDIGLQVQTLVTDVITRPGGSWLIGVSGGTLYVGDTPPVQIRSSAAVQVNATALQFNGLTSSFPGLRGVGAVLQAVVGAGSGYAAFQALSYSWGGGTLVQSSTDGDLLLSNAAATSFGTIRFGGTTSAFPALRRSGTELQALLADGSAYTTFRCADYIATNSFQSTSNSGFISVGSPTATQGAIRLWKDGYIYVRNQTNTADIVILGASPPGVFITSSSAPVLYPGSGDAAGQLGDSTHRWQYAYLSTAVVIGALPATTGAVRLANGDGIFSRNAANTADIRLLRLTASDVITFGAGAAALVLSGPSVTIGASYFEGSEMTAPAAPAADQFRIYAEDNGAGKTRLMVLFASGAAQQIAIQP